MRSRLSVSADERSGGGDLAESLARFILDADPAIAGVGAAERRGPSAGPVLSAPRGPDQPRVLQQPASIPPKHQLPPGPPASGEQVTW